MVTLHDFLPSGNGYKCRLMLRFLGRPFTLVEYDITNNTRWNPPSPCAGSG